MAKSRHSSKSATLDSHRTLTQSSLSILGEQLCLHFLICCIMFSLLPHIDRGQIKPLPAALYVALNLVIHRACIAYFQQACLGSPGAPGHTDLRQSSHECYSPLQDAGVHVSRASKE